MIIEFSVGNYRSFKEIVTFSMVAANIKSEDKSLDENNIFPITKNISLVKSAVIYGANASGKSNLIKAIEFMRNFVRNSSRNMTLEDLIKTEEFRLSQETEGQPSFFQIIFLLDNKKYRYGFEVTKKRVVSEWLFSTTTIKEAKLFTREGDEISDPNRYFREGKKELQDFVRLNSLYLSVVAQFNGEISSLIVKWFKMLRVYYGGLSNIGGYGYFASMLQNPKYSAGIIELIKQFDFGIEGIGVGVSEVPFENVTVNVRTDAPNVIHELGKRLGNFLQEFNKSQEDNLQMLRIKTLHSKYSKDKELVSQEEFFLEEHESSGTVKFFALVASLADVLNTGKVFIIDELDIRFHTHLTQMIVKLFNSNITNPNNAQLIFTTHDTNLLTNTEFRRDQIWFIEKDKYGVSHPYSLVEYKVRNDASYEKDYIKGRYGAIPFIGDVKELLGKQNEQN